LTSFKKNLIMTETAKVEDTNGKHTENGEMSELDKSINKQVTYYFGDFNLPRDEFLLEKVKSNEDGWIGIDVMLKFQRLNKLSSEEDVILKALKKSEDNLIEVDLENKKIRRNPDLPLPESEDDETKKLKTVYLKGFEKTNTTLDDLLGFFAKYDNVIHVNRRTWIDRKDDSRNFKGSVFVTFKDKASAEAFMALESVKNPEGEELVRKWQTEYFEEKSKELEEKRAKKSSDKRSKAKIVEEQGKKDEAEKEKVAEENKLPKGATMFMEGFKDDTKREDIKEALKEQFEVDDKAFAFMEFERGQTSGYVRFIEENAAIDLAAKIKEKLGETEKLKIKEAEIDFRVLEGQEESDHLDNALKVMKMRKDKYRGHKRHHGGRGGRGGKRGRRD